MLHRLRTRRRSGISTNCRCGQRLPDAASPGVGEEKTSDCLFCSGRVPAQPASGIRTLVPSGCPRPVARKSRASRPSHRQPPRVWASRPAAHSRRASGSAPVSPAPAAPPRVRASSTLRLRASSSRAAPPTAPPAPRRAAPSLRPAPPAARTARTARAPRPTARTPRPRTPPATTPPQPPVAPAA